MAGSRKTVLITGYSLSSSVNNLLSDRCYRCSPGGIGNALARQFHAKGLRVLATARTADTIQDLADLGIVTLSLEVDQEESINVCKEKVKELTGGGLDYLVNNAGRSK